MALAAVRGDTVTVAFAGDGAVQAASLVITPAVTSAVVRTGVPVLAQAGHTPSKIELEAGRT